MSALRFSARQREVVRHAVLGSPRPTCGPSTYKTHVRAVLRKTKAANLAQLALWVLRRDGDVGTTVAGMLDRGEL